MQIDTLDQWAEIAQKLSERGYSLFQTQFDIDSPEGFIARFLAPYDRLPRVEHVTYDAGVRDAMLRYKP